MQKAERELIELNFKVVTDKLESMHKEFSLANQKVKKIERETRFFRWVERNPKASIGLGLVLVVGFVSIGTLIGWNTIINKLM